MKNKSDLFIVCGERSGDLHGSELVKEILKINPQIKIHCWGGELMKSSGAKLIEDYSSYSIMGFVEVFKKIFFLYNKIKKCESDILKLNPKRVLLIDFPGFNLRIAKFCKRNKIDVDYLIPPKTWAWNSRRNLILKKNINNIYSILPFEKKYFSKEGVEVSYIGNPLIYRIKKNSIKKNRNYIGLFPGSRGSEIKYSLPIFIELIKYFVKEDFIVFGVSNLNSSSYDIISKFSNVKMVFDDTYVSLNQCKYAVVMSGTASLEVSLMRVPHIVVFKASNLSYFIAKLLVKLKFFSLVNIIMEKEVVKELIQDKFNFENIKNELNYLKKDETQRKMIDDFNDLSEIIGDQKSSEKLAKIISEKIL